jgi:multisubunit Na+/H+ antiporter MnhC subunit
MFIVICIFLSYIVNHFQILFGLHMLINGLIYFVLVVGGTIDVSYRASTNMDRDNIDGH